ncbi:MAG TPA: phage portal protein, partial [Bacillaceae bacterium]
DVDGKAGQADADYIYKQYDVAGTEAYKSRVFDNILLFTNIPNLLDSKFAGNQSGEALKMKLFGLSQKRATKERLFKKSLRDRYRLINNIMSTASEGTFDVNDLSISFTENLPKAIEQELKWFGELGGQLSQKTLLSLLSFVENPQEELDKIAAENKLNQPLFEFPKEVTNDE